LRSTPQQQVAVQQPADQTIYVIQPASPQVVYVPQYDPAVVYVRPSTDAIIVASLISFGVGIGIGALLVDNRPWGWGGWGWNWGSRRVFYNPIVWGGWHDPYRPPRPWHRPRPIVGSNRPGYGGDWRYVREIVARLILRITVLATIVRLTDRVTRQVTTGREIVPVAIVRHLNHPGPLHPGRRVNRIGRVDHRSRPGRNGRARAGLRSLVKRDRHVRINLVPQGLRLSQNLEVRAAHRHSPGSVNN